MTLQTLLKEIASYNPHANTALITKAYRYAEKAHEGQLRESGVPYFDHCCGVAEILAELKLNSVTIAAGLLHDVLEDTKMRLVNLRDMFGSEIAGLVEGVTKIDRIKLDSQEEEKAQNIRKILLATSKDVRVILIKLADRLHNMRTLKFLPEDKQERIAKETLDIYAPIAHKLGIYKIKSELEDLSLRHINPDIYQNLKQLIKEKRAEREEKLKEVIRELKKLLKRHQLEAEVTGRAKTFYSIFKKIQVRKKHFDNIYDLLAFRVVAESVEDCYRILGLIHSHWRYMPSEFTDHIANPKPNGYQSIHTKIIYDGKPIEIQIRTGQMHLEAEEGIAAHWRYKGTERDKKFDQKIGWLRQILEWERTSENAKQLIETLKIDLFMDEIIVFTPKGDPVALPDGSTPIDFAYEIHTNLGNHCLRAKVNNQLVSLDHRLHSGDVVEIQISSNAKPSRQWLSFARTNQARAKIRSALGIESEKNQKRTKADQETLDQVEVEGKKKVKIKFSKCCKVSYGEPIQGFKTKDGRISVHSSACTNVDAMESKKIDVRWKLSGGQQAVRKRISIAAKDKVGLLHDILNVIVIDKINITSINSKTRKKHVVMNLTLELADPDSLEELIARIKYVPEVIDVHVVDY